MELGERSKRIPAWRRLGAVGALLATTAFGAIAAAAPALAQRAVAQGTRTFNIPPQPLADALVQFGYQSGLQIAADGGLTASARSPGVSGTYAPADALGRLLAGTGLTFQFTNATSIQLQRASAAGAGSGAMQLDPLQVQGNAVPTQAMIDNLPPVYAGGQVATGGQLGLLGNRDVMDTPFNQTSYTAKKVQDQQARTVRDALIDDPSVQMLWPNGSSSADGIKIRGFDIGVDVAYGGLYGILPYWSIAPELAERIEVLKGPSAMLNGMPPGGAVGGSINVAAKHAADDPLTQFTMGYASNAQFGGHADVGRRYGPEKQFGIRFNGVYRAGQTAVDRNADTTGLGVLGLDFRGDRVRLSADMGYEYRYISGLVVYPSISAGIPVPGAPNASSNFGQPWAYSERKDVFGVVRGEVDLAENVTAYAAFGAHDSRTRSLESGSPTILGVNGNIAQTPYNFSAYLKVLSGEAGLRALVDTGPIRHAFNISGTAYEQEQGVGSTNGTSFASNIYKPNLIARPDLANPSANKSSVTRLSSLAFADTLSAVEGRIQLTAGARLQRVAVDNFNIVTGVQTSSYDQSAVSPSVALVVKPLKNVSLYGNWIQGLQQGTTVGAGFANTGQTFAPYKSTQYEVGIKVDWSKFTTTLSAFQITQPSTLVDSTTNTLNLNGEQRNRGIEFNVFGVPVEGVRLLGGAMLLDATLTKTAGGLTDGWAAPGTPNVQINLGGEWDLPFARGLTLNGRMIYSGFQYVDVSSPRRTIPAWARFDVGLRYTFENAQSPTGKPVTIRFNVENIFDTNYWAATSNSHYLIQGAPRTFLLSTTFDF